MITLLYVVHAPPEVPKFANHCWDLDPFANVHSTITCVVALDRYQSEYTYAAPPVTGCGAKYHFASPLVRAVMSTRNRRAPL